VCTCAIVAAVRGSNGEEEDSSRSGREQRKMDATPQRVISGLLLFTLATLHLGKSPGLLTASGHDAIVR